MSTVGVRELKIKASEIIRSVREEQARYTITHRGKPVAVLLPIAEAPEQQVDEKQLLEDVLQLGQDIAENWMLEQTPTEILLADRR